jgi:dihydroflavonol-4-reductase
MRVLATGANGHLGANVVRSLLARGYEVVPFVRQGADLRGLQGLDLSYVYGDIMDQQALIDAAQGCDVMVHMAAVYRYWARDPDEIIQPALVGTRNAFAAAKAAGMRRMVYTSTTWAVGVSKDPNTLRTAADWNEEPHSPYAKAKTEAEKEAWRLADEAGISMISICPGAILGPYDYRITPSMSLLLGWINGANPIYKSGMCFVDVRDVAEVHAGAVETDKGGDRFIAGGENKLNEQTSEIITELTGVKPLHLPGGRGVFKLVAAVSEVVSAITRGEPLLSREVAEDLGERYMFYDCADTNRTLGITPKNAKESLAEGIRWLLHIGAIKASIAARIRSHFPPDPTWVA